MGLKNLDLDILFNLSDWERCIQSQAALFDLQALVAISDQLRVDFHQGHSKDRQMPEIARGDWVTPLLEKYAEASIGYDLPCLISANRPVRGRLMFCAQDPLRRPGPAKLTVGTFFGLDSDYHRVRRHWGAMWQLICSCVFAGYDVWVTDAIKLYAGKDVVGKDSQLMALCLNVLENEISAFVPEKILAVGGRASWALSSVCSDIPIVHVPHPTARGQKGAFSERFQVFENKLLHGGH